MLRIWDYTVMIFLRFDMQRTDTIYEYRQMIIP